MGMRRTVPVKLDVDSDDAVLLDETVDQFIMTVVAVYR
jgi:hypothetical protein